jgi:hypothetical protein
MTPRVATTLAERHTVRRQPRWWEGSGDWLLNILVAALPFFVNSRVWFLTGPIVSTYPAVRVNDLCFFGIFLSSAHCHEPGIGRARHAPRRDCPGAY